MIYFHVLLVVQALTNFDLSNNQIGETGAQYLAEVLRKNTVGLDYSPHLINFHLSLFMQVLTRLVLSSNQIGDKGVQYLAETLQNNTVRSYQSRQVFHFCFFDTGTH